MDIHEYQAKEILADFGVPIPRGGLAYSPEQAAYRATEIGGQKWVVKAQVHSGARGKAGGIRVCADDREIRAAAGDLLGTRLVTHQTGPRGKVVYRLYVEAAVNVAHEYYLGFVLDRRHESPNYSRTSRNPRKNNLPNIGKDHQVQMQNVSPGRSFLIDHRSAVTKE